MLYDMYTAEHMTYIAVVIIEFGLTVLQTQIFVNSISSDLDLSTGGLSRAIATKAGYKLQDELRRQSSYLRTTNPTAYNTMIPTRGYNLLCDFVYHVILPFVSSTSYQHALQVSVSIDFSILLCLRQIKTVNSL